MLEDYYPDGYGLSGVSDLHAFQTLLKTCRGDDQGQVCTISKSVPRNDAYCRFNIDV